MPGELCLYTNTTTKPDPEKSLEPSSPPGAQFAPDPHRVVHICAWETPEVGSLGRVLLVPSDIENTGKRRTPLL